MKGAVIRFDENHALWVKETPEKVEAAVVEAAASRAPLLHFTLENGTYITVNPAQIRTIAAQP